MKIDGKLIIALRKYERDIDRRRNNKMIAINTIKKSMFNLNLV
jgi:hypothetical protein